MLLLQAVVVLGGLIELAGEHVKTLDELLSFFLQQFLLLPVGGNFILDNEIVNPPLLVHLCLKIGPEFELELVNIPKLFLPLLPGPQQSIDPANFCEIVFLFPPESLELPINNVVLFLECFHTRTALSAIEVFGTVPFVVVLDAGINRLSSLLLPHNKY